MSLNVAARVAPEKQGPIAPLSAAACFKRESAMETRMAYKAYWEKLRDPRWQRKRLEVMQRADFKCEACDADEATLNVHHKIYRKGVDPWEYSDTELRCLCEACHEGEHGLRKRLDEALVHLQGYTLEQVVGFAEGLAALDTEAHEALSIVSIHHAAGIHAAIKADVLDGESLLARCEGDSKTGIRLTADAFKRIFDEQFPNFGKGPL